jgi:1,4-dihydroxy-2-naphthoyl-CoA synthase
MTEPILFTVDRGLARITLNRPERLNAFDDATAHAWADITAEAVVRDDVPRCSSTPTARRSARAVTCGRWSSWGRERVSPSSPG